MTTKKRIHLDTNRIWFWSRDDKIHFSGVYMFTHDAWIHRHGSRYPEKYSGVEKFGKALEDDIRSGAKFSGALSFLNTWEYGLGWDYYSLWLAGRY